MVADCKECGYSASGSKCTECDLGGLVLHCKGYHAVRHVSCAGEKEELRGDDYL